MKTVLLRDGRKQWRATVDDVKVTYEFGVVDGKQQSETTIYTEGKNIGKSNETTPAQQCMADALVKIRKKMEKGYKLIEGDLDAPVETTSNLEAPKPMLAQDLHDHLKKLTIVESLFFQPKLDGNRALIDLTNGKMYSRNRKEIPHLSHISEAVVVACQELISVGIRWVDGELYSPNMSFNMIQTLIRRVSGDSKTRKGSHIETPEQFAAMKQMLQFFMFDILVDRPFSERKALLDKVQANQFVYVVPTITGTPSDLNKVHDTFVNQGYEGAMVRFDGIPYEQKRSMSLFKWKAFTDEEFAVVDFEAEKHDPSKLGAAILMDRSGHTFGARPAMSDTMKAEIWSNKASYIGKIATVKFQERDAQSGIPRFPVLVRFREEE